MIESVEEVKNDSLLPIDVHIEPWGAVHKLAPGKTLRIVAQSSYGTCRCTVFSDGSDTVIEYDTCGSGDSVEPV